VFVESLHLEALTKWNTCI